MPNKKIKPLQVNETNQMWRDVAEEQKQKRKEKRGLAKKDIEVFCTAHSLIFKELQPTQFRISKDEKRLDVYPIHQRWHYLNADQRGGYRDVFELLNKFFLSEV